MQRRTFIKNTGSVGLFALWTPSFALETLSGQVVQELENDFVRPPLSAYPQTLWFWMNGHISKQGITLDLEAMMEAGIGGVYNFDAGTDIPAGPIKYLSSEWLALKKHAILECERLGLHFVLHNCPGWSSSGGPWITPELAMQQVTWSEMYIKGGKEINISLPKPFHKLDFYKDIAILAIPSLTGEALLQTFRASTASGFVDKKQLTGENPEGIDLPVDEKSKVKWIKFEFEAPYEARSITFLISSPNSPEASRRVDYNDRTYVILQSSQDGQRFKDVVAINTGLESELAAGYKFITFDFPATKAKFFRITSKHSRRLAQVRFSEITRLDQWMEKSGYRYQFSGEGTSPIYKDNHQQVESGSIVALEEIADISEFVDKEGRLQWNAPPGDWTLLRIGYTPVGTLNRAAPDQGIGLECDKYSSEAFEFHFQKMMESFLPLLKTLASRGAAGVEIDSYEARSQNWTPLFHQEFKQRSGYEITKYLPILTGRIIEDVETTERFLWDFRRTQAGLIADHYYGRFAALCREHQLTPYIQPYDRGPMEEMQIGAKVDVNIGESWYGLHSVLQSNRTLDRTLKLAASIAHTNGQKFVGAEAYTAEPESGRWQEYPFAMKALGDKMFTKGINRLIIHRFAHQPHPTAVPGMTMGPWGIHFDRTNTWWKEGRSWLSYIARCQGILQQGLVVADLVYFSGEDANLYTKVNRSDLHPSPPEGYDYDMINAETIIQKVTIKNGRLELNDGMNYRVLILQEFKAISLELLLKLRALVQEGMVMVGAKPLHSLGLNDFADRDAVFQKVAQEIWGGIDGEAVTVNKFGKGYVYYGQSLVSIFQELKLKPDFEALSQTGKAPVCYIHKKSGDTDFFFISNQRRTYEQWICTFRIENKQPELWDAVTGRIINLNIYEIVEDCIRMPLQLEPYGSVFIVFRKPVSSRRLHAVLKDQKPLLSTDIYPPSAFQLYQNVVNNFSISFWAKPEMPVMLQSSIFSEGIKHPWTDYYAIYPLNGKEIYGEGHVTCGITVGRNGVAVWEHGGEAPILILAVPISISGWTHIALIYHNGEPVVYVSGKKAGEGTKGKSIVHPPLGDMSTENISYYNGDMTKPEFISKVLNEEDVKQLATHLSELQHPPFAVEITAYKKTALLFWQNGEYSLCYHSGKQKKFVVSEIPETRKLEGPWEVQFPYGKGAPSNVILPLLSSLHKHANAGVKYFSGTAEYKISFSTSFQKKKSELRYFLDLGRVEVIAEVLLNGVNLGIFWKRPYRIEITKAVQAGTNTVVIKVTNLWPNRLIGDEQAPDPYRFSPGAGSSGMESLFNGGILEVPEWYTIGAPKPEDGRVTFTTWKHYHKDSPLLESGLIGPVLLLCGVLKEV
ncbi:glycosyl hydrolase [Chitinophagaceae bacterium LB-8]|uniref:Glycosyl hydrolase n=1 Tax=Paraflavisolibacter caeni TaxID=2982496 RepID=A0A9X2Y235_9BACT|nr:glycosyl hydrolase [Paraflavisolibacter caeni]MCU7552153.1 glycosyl hydrolase [Paraflavisolibacter caeni]